MRKKLNLFISACGIASTLLVAPAVGHAVAGGHQQPKYYTSCNGTPCWSDYDECFEIAEARNENPNYPKISGQRWSCGPTSGGFWYIHSIPNYGY